MSALSKVVIAGGSGFIGREITKQLVEEGTQVTILTRSKSSTLPAGARRSVWDYRRESGTPWIDDVRGADAVMNVCGYPVVSRWSAAGKRMIEESRIQSTEVLTRAIRGLGKEERPRVYVGGSAVGYYGMHESKVFDEGDTVGEDFLARLCERWESAATEGLKEVEDTTRVVVVRTGVVLGKDGGALARMIPAFKLFVGGPVGSGRQMVSWVHIEDIARVFIEAAKNETMRGAYNGTAPGAVSMAVMARSLGKAMSRPSLFAVPGVVLQAAFGEGSCVVLQGKHVRPTRLAESGFLFRYERIDDAMEAVVGSMDM
ncbi:Epimerase family protein SDR39U1-like [Gracilariopsis chorda]|uniref:Epimerase family protein SDR39U1-like n=1 Tax=Gracilariopsis chorda TaxID=448386 RepID=A0A2V3ISY0_9FLOR|nr:Epimerase family protein SDR39U1-like [Gracilariopsis chorda]|eukprot:PXF45231.1 Epimerase family protein SDR39U1-like [Gracilariopsis chorda]